MQDTCMLDVAWQAQRYDCHHLVTFPLPRLWVMTSLCCPFAVCVCGGHKVLPISLAKSVPRLQANVMAIPNACQCGGGQSKQDERMHSEVKKCLRSVKAGQFVRDNIRCQRW